MQKTPFCPSGRYFFASVYSKYYFSASRGNPFRTVCPNGTATVAIALLADLIFSCFLPLDIELSEHKKTGEKLTGFSFANRI